MGSHTAFFYGTLMAKEILHRVIYGEGQVTNNPAKAHLASQLSIRPAILHNYCRHRVARADYPGMIPKSGHSVRGTYVTGLTDADVARLDMFEGDEYTREKVKVRVLIPSASGESESEELEAESYVYTAGEGYLEKKEWDYEEFRREKMHRWTGESQEFKEADEYEESTDEESEHDGGRSVVIVSKDGFEEGNVKKGEVEDELKAAV